MGLRNESQINGRVDISAVFAPARFTIFYKGVVMDGNEYEKLWTRAIIAACLLAIGLCLLTNYLTRFGS